MAARPRGRTRQRTMNSNVDDTDLDSKEPQAEHPRERVAQSPDDAQMGDDEMPAHDVTRDLEALAAEREALRDQLLRVTAEFDNYRKRIDRERRDMANRAAEGVLGDLLPIVDDLERALEVEAPDEATRAYRTGVELIHRQLLELLSRRGVTPIVALGEDFDPHVHQAVATEPAGARRDGEVVEELRRGYRLGDRLLRAAMVRVTKA